MAKGKDQYFDVNQYFLELHFLVLIIMVIILNLNN